MSIFSKDSSQDNAFPIKPLLVILAIVAIAGGAYFLTHKKTTKEETKNADGAVATVKPTGLNLSDSVSNVGDVEKIIAKWVETNPEAIIQAVVNMQQKAMKQQVQDAQKNISSKSDDVFNHKSDPVFAPKNSNIILVEFFDYNCGYCKKSQSTIEKLLDEDKKIKVIYKEYPILGPSSEELSLIALAVNMIDPNNYVKFHNALMKSPAKNRDDALKVAQDSGINVDKLKKTLEASKDDLNALIAFNRQLGGSIGVNGTPAFIVGEELISGAVEISVLKEKIDALRKAKK